MTKQSPIYAGLNIPQAIAGSRSNLPWFCKNPLIDFSSFRERARIAQERVEKAFEYARDCRIALYGSSYNHTLRQLSRHRGACLAVAEKLLSRKVNRNEIEYLNDADRAHVLVDVLALFPGRRARGLAKKIVEYVPDPLVREKAKKLAKKMKTEFRTGGR